MATLLLTRKEQRACAELLRRVTFPVIPELFDAWANACITNPCELAVLRGSGPETEILLVYRNDVWYDGYHIPGSIVLPGRSVGATRKLLIKREIGLPVSEPEFVSWLEFMKGDGEDENSRGHEISLLFARWAEGDPKQGTLFPLDRIPQNTLGSHRVMIERLRA